MSLRKTTWLVLAAALLLVALSMVSNPIVAAPPSQDAGIAALQGKSEGTLVVERTQATGMVTFLSTDGGALTREFAGKGAEPEQIAREFLATYGKLFGITDQTSQLALKSLKTDSVGMQHVRFTQTQNGVPVFGADIIVHLAEDGAVTAVNGYMAPNATATDTKAALDATAAHEIARKSFEAQDGVVVEDEMVVLNAGLISDEATESYLTYRVKVDSATEPHLATWYFVDAHTGEVRFTLPAVYDARNRKTYNMKTGTDYNAATLMRSEGQAAVGSATSCTATDVNNAHDYAGDTYDFFYNRFGRDSYNNAGGALLSYVCYGVNFQNAYWDGSKMTYGAGYAAADDVVGHELGHGVTEYASGLIYAYQSGALNESYSDIFGEAIDQVNGRGTDTSAVRWDVGEDIPGGGAIRDMMTPGAFGDPNATNSANYYCATGVPTRNNDYGGVHINSGVPNQAFALMVDGGTLNGISVTSVGFNSAVQVQYRANEYYLTPTSKLVDNYNALNRACADLYGSSSTTCTNVRRAGDAVKMNGPVCGSIIANGDFENGRDTNGGIGWTIASTKNYSVINTGSAYAGSYKAWLGGGDSENGNVYQTIQVPSNGGTLYYRYKIASTDSCGYDYGRVYVNSTAVRTHNLCSSNSTGSTYAQGSVSLTSYAGQSVTLKFQATTDGSISSSFFIDNVTFSAGVGKSEAVDPHASEGEMLFPEAKPTVFENGEMQQ